MSSETIQKPIKINFTWPSPTPSDSSFVDSVISSNNTSGPDHTDFFGSSNNEIELDLNKKTEKFDQQISAPVESQGSTPFFHLSYLEPPSTTPNMTNTPPPPISSTQEACSVLLGMSNSRPPERNRVPSNPYSTSSSSNRYQTSNAIRQHSTVFNNNKKIVRDEDLPQNFEQG